MKSHVLSDDTKGANKWVLSANEKVPGQILVDFSPKGGPVDILGVYDQRDNGIHWPDGNTWTKQ
jgi:hypothetical protein